MPIGFDAFNFEVSGAFRGPDEVTLKKCCEPGHNLVFLKDRDQLVNVPIKYLMGIYSFFTGKELKAPEAGEEAEWKKVNVPIIRASFDDSFIQDSKVFLKLKAEEPKPKKSAKAPVEEETEREEETEEPEPTQSKKQTKETKMATKKAAKKAPAKKAAKKAPAKAEKKSADGTGKRGRKARYEDDAKIKVTVKENPCNPTFAGKPSRRFAAFNIVLKNNGLTFAEYMKKGGNAFDLFALHQKKHVTIG